jgi:hypothetical protein
MALSQTQRMRKAAFLSLKNKELTTTQGQKLEINLNSKYKRMVVNRLPKSIWGFISDAEKTFC